MNMPDTEMGGTGRAFPATSWSVLRHVRDRRSEQYSASMQRLIGQYWKPVYCLIRSAWRKSNEEAKDLTQDFFVSAVIEGSLVESFAAERGSFRSFLKAAVMNFIRNANRTAGRLKRGGEAVVLSLDMDGIDPAGLVAGADGLPPEELFDTAWKAVLIARAVEQVEQRLRAEGKDVVFEVFRRYDLAPEGGDISYRTVGDALGLSPDTIKNHLTRARQEFKRAIMRLVSDYVDTDQALASEMRELFGGWGSP